ncbi:hypothetical protein PUN49_15195 [Pseudomonas extremaustralis]|uniref:hypothetical protein n=1 Tax=Pseudomonas extremaustralis TaxID=359110 RepID=UPI0021C86EDE|nr:hypothetical protein [Pseudomonas extremaustralis]MDB1114040.1 hypothetical protein [Pseudomonas extremaustralis]MDG2968378.1 hypothetical protein [Pseudomonas extremaustralis]UUJ43333.1 hypothetical protein L1A22_13950 [Pseudomonas extremaustralis]
MAWLLSGCSLLQTESFNFQAELPENFTISATTYYDAATGESCPGHKVIKSDQPKGTQLIELKLPLTEKVKGCSRVLKSVVLNIEGQWGKRDLDIGLQRGALSIRDEPTETTRPFPASGPLVFLGQCQWFFRTMGPYRYIVKVLECRALDANGVVQKSLAGGSMLRDGLAGRTVKLVLTEAKEEEPYFDRYWIKTMSGWKPCKGNWGRDIEELCVSPPQFKPFKMPDGRDCTVYPNCTE